jgi:RNA polymerase sigma-70 factor (ECF subfamily)
MAPTPHDLRDDLRDELLAVRCQLGERAALDELIERWHAPLWGYVRRLLDDSDMAAEVLQEVWIRVLRGLPALRQPSRLRAWLFTIARRTSMDRLRIKYSEPPAASLDDVEVAAQEEADGAQDIEAMQQELARMPLVEREVLALFYLEELTLEQIADVLGVPSGTVKSRLFRARRMLRQQVTGQGVNPRPMHT